VQLNRKYHFLENSRACLDLCAAPGGWLQVAAKTMPVASLILGIDLVAIKPIRGVTTLQGDITTQKARQDIKATAKGQMFDCVIHDGAPNVGGAWATEAYSQAWLVLESCKLACEFLRPGGTFVTKVFRSKEYTSLLYAFQQLFGKVEATKPPSSRNTSAEIFVVCLDYKAPSKIDPRLLDHKTLFQEVDDGPRAMGPDALLKLKTKQRRFREGYEEGISTTHKALSAVHFVLSQRAPELLGGATQLFIDGPQSEVIPRAEDDKDFDDDEVERTLDLARLSQHTTAEVRALCQDLQVLGRSELRQLLKWRNQLRRQVDKWRKENAKAAKEDEGGSGSEGEGEEGAPAGEEGTDEALLREMADIRARMDDRSKREKKKARELKKKRKIRAAQTTNKQDDKDGEDVELFDLKRIKTQSGVEAVAQAGVPEVEDFESSEEEMEEMSDYGSGSEEESDGDSEREDRLRYEELMEEMLERSHQQKRFKQGTLGKTQLGDHDAVKIQRMDDDGEIGNDGWGGADAVERLGGKAAAVSRRMARGPEEEGDGGLIVTFDKRKAGVTTSKSAAAQQWFGDAAFSDALGVSAGARAGCTRPLYHS